MRFPPGVVAQCIGPKHATLMKMGLIMVALLFGYFFVNSFSSLLAMGVLLGIAGASFGMALSLGSGSIPALYKDLATGLVVAGNVNTAVSMLMAPALTQRFGTIGRYGWCYVSPRRALATAYCFSWCRWPPQWPAP